MNVQLALTLCPTGECNVLCKLKVNYNIYKTTVVVFKKNALVTCKISSTCFDTKPKGFEVTRIVSGDRR